MPDLCKSDAVVILTGNPPGGTYSGNGVSGTNFNPNSVAKGSIRVIYQYTDNNGCNDTAAIAITVSGCTSVFGHNLKKNEFKVSPNPASKKITIHSDQNIVEFKIYDMLGKEVMRGAQNEIDITGLSPGMYLISISSLSLTSQQRVIILND